MHVCRLELWVYTQIPTGLSWATLLKAKFFFSSLELIHGRFHVKPSTLMVCLNLQSIMGFFSPGLCLDWQPGVLLKGMPGNQCETEETACRVPSFMCWIVCALARVCVCVWDPEHVGHFLVEPPSLSACLFWCVKDYFQMIIVACRPRSRRLAPQISELILGTSAHFAVFNLMSLASSSFSPPPPLFPRLPLNSLVSNSNRLVCLDNRII